MEASFGLSLDCSLDLCRFVLEAKNVEKHNVLGSFSSIFASKLDFRISENQFLEICRISKSILNTNLVEQLGISTSEN